MITVYDLCVCTHTYVGIYIYIQVPFFSILYVLNKQKIRSQLHSFTLCKPNHYSTYEVSRSARSHFLRTVQQRANIWLPCPVIVISRFPTQTLHAILISSTRATCTVYPILFDLINLIIVCEGCTLWSFSSCNLLQLIVTYCLLGLNILLRTSLSNTLKHTQTTSVRYSVKPRPVIFVNSRWIWTR
jgi:hypothetical protein